MIFEPRVNDPFTVDCYLTDQDDNKSGWVGYICYTEEADLGFSQQDAYWVLTPSILQQIVAKIHELEGTPDA